MESQNVQLIGAPCGKHGPYTFYKAFKYFKDSKVRILTLGEFFFLKILKEGPICIGELQLLWDNTTDSQLLTSVRLYFLPENTPAGREHYHGEDEILSFTEKLILKLEDLAGLIITEKVKWRSGLRLLHSDTVQGGQENGALENKFFSDTRNSGLDMKDVEEEKNKAHEADNNSDKVSSTDVRIISYAQYCRYRAIMKRLENMADKWLKNKIVCALGGLTSCSRSNRIMFCRDTFDSVDLDDYELRMDHLAPNLKGRPRKKRSSKSEQDSDSNETSSDISSPSSVKLPGKRESALRNGYKFDKNKVCKDEQSLLLDLHEFMKKRNTPIGRIPSLGFKQIDLYYFWTYSQKLGGYEQITNKRLWKHLYDQLGGNPGSTSAATCTRRHYEKLLLPYERHLKGESQEKLPVSSLKPNKRAQLLAKAKFDMRRRVNPDNKIDRDDELVNSIVKKRRRCRLDLSQEKVKLWEDIRKAKAMERDKIKKVTRHPKTVKNLLNSTAERNSSNMMVENMGGESREEALVKSIRELKEAGSKMRAENDLMKEVKSENISYSTENGKANDTKNLINQSRLFRPDSVQSKSSVIKSEEMGQLSTAQLDGRAIPIVAGHPVNTAMFYPPTFIPLGQGLPLGLPVMHQLPIAMPTYIPEQQQTSSSSSEKQHNSFRPNILRTSNSHVGSSTISSSPTPSQSSDRPSVIQHAHQNKLSSHLPPSRESSATNNAIKSPHLSPTYNPQPAHSGQKRSYNSPSDIPPSYRSSSKSLLFDFESPKRQRLESPSAAHTGNPRKGANSQENDDQPTDLSMKTLRKMENKDNSRLINNGEVIDLQCYSPAYKTDRVSSPSVKSKHQTHHPSYSSTSRAIGMVPPDVVIPSDSHSSVFNKASLVTAHSNYGNSRAETQTRNVPPAAHSKKQATESIQRSSSSSSSSSLSTPTPTHPSAALPHIDSSGIVHPAFPYLRAANPQTNYFPTPMQLQQMYEAQIRANAVHAAAFEDMMKRDPGQFGGMALPLFMPQVPLHTQAAKDKPSYAK